MKILLKRQYIRTNTPTNEFYRDTIDLIIKSLMCNNHCSEWNFSRNKCWGEAKSSQKGSQIFNQGGKIKKSIKNQFNIRKNHIIWMKCISGKVRFRRVFVALFWKIRSIFSQGGIGENEEGNATLCAPLATRLMCNTYAN